MNRKELKALNEVKKAMKKNRDEKKEIDKDMLKAFGKLFNIWIDAQSWETKLYVLEHWEEFEEEEE